MADKAYRVWLQPEDWKRVSDALILTAQEHSDHSGDHVVDTPEDQINRTLWEQLDRQGMAYPNG